MTFIQDLKRGMVIGFKVSLTVYAVCGIMVIGMFAPVPFMFVAGDVLTSTLDAIWK